ncbi:hypothetical protein [Methanobrevibacter sp.]|uniref:hypothetical protein n=1 Tax=Methanobrevibacter sp. TaxID=66852 RepID=UPI003865803F
MKFKKILLVSIILLAVLTIGAVGASDNITSDELSACDDGDILDISHNDELSDMNKDDVSIAVEDIDTANPSANFTTISVTERVGNFVICCDDGENSKEVYRDYLSSSDKYYEKEGKFCFGVSFEDVNNYISEHIQNGNTFYDEVSSANTLRFVLEYQDTDFVTKTYDVDFDGNVIRLDEKVIDKYAFNCFFHSYSYMADNDFTVVQVWPNEVSVGTLVLNVTKSNGDSQCYSKDIENDMEDNQVYWQLGELDIVDEPGVYAFNVYYNDDLELDSCNFTLTQVNFRAMDGRIYFEYPFEVLRVFSEDADVEVYVNDDSTPCEMLNEDGIYWTLSDLGISGTGDYNITFISYDDGDVVDNLTFNLNVVDDLDEFCAYSSFDNQVNDLETPLIYLFSPGDRIGEKISMYVDDEYFDDFDVVSNWMSWNLAELGIDSNGGHGIRLCDADDNEFAFIWLDVNCIISSESFNPWVSSFEQVNSEEDPCIVNVHVDYNVQEGGINLTIVRDGEIIFSEVKSIEENANEDHDVYWSLDELREHDILNDVGEYLITLKYVGDEVEFGLCDECTLVLTEFAYNIYQGNIHIAYPFDVIRVWSEDVNVEVILNGTSYSNGEENPLRWTLSDLNITEVGEYTITVKASNDECEDEFSFNLNVYNDTDSFILISDDLGISDWELDGPVLYLLSPDDKIGETFTLSVNDEESELEITDSLMSWNLEDLNIYENGDYDVRIFDGDEEVAQINFYIDCIEEKIRVNFWDEGVLYDDCTDEVISIEIPDDERWGTILILVNGEERITWDIDGNDYNDWSLSDLGITEAGEYEINVKRVWEDDGINEEEDIDEGFLNVTTFNYDAFRALLDKDSEVIKIYCPDYANGTIYISVERREEDEDPVSVHDEDYTIQAEDKDNWIEFLLKDLGFMHDGNEYGFDILVRDDSDDEVDHFSMSYSVEKINPDVWNDEYPLYLDCDASVIRIDIPRGNFGRLEVIVNDVKLYSFKVKPDREYQWNLESLNITAPGQSNVTVKFIGNDGSEEILCDETLNVVEFLNDTARVKRQPNPEDDEGSYNLYLFAPENSDVAIVVSLIHEADDWSCVDEFELKINSTYYNKWININDLVDSVDLKSMYTAKFRESTDEEGEKIFIVDLYRIGDEENSICNFEIDYRENVDLNELIEDVLNSNFYLECNGVTCNGENVNIEESPENVKTYPGISINYHDSHDDFFDSKNEIAYVFLPYDNFGDNVNVTITSGDLEYFINFNGDSEYIWYNYNYIYVINRGVVNDFAGIPDKAKVIFTIKKADNSKNTYTCFLKKNTLELYLFDENDMLLDFNILMHGEEDDDENIPVTFNDTKIGEIFAEVTIGEEYNVTDGEIVIFSGDKIILSRKLSELEQKDVYAAGGTRYYLPFEGFNLEGLKDKDLINFTVVSEGKVIQSATLIYRIVDEDNVQFFELYTDINFDIHYEKLANPSYGVAGSISDGSFIVLEIPEYRDIKEGEIVIIRDDTGEVLFSKSLTSFDNSDSRFSLEFVEDHQSWEYVINADESIYGKFPENVNMTFSFNYANNSISRKAVRIGDSLYKINTPYDISLLFNVTIEKNVICQGEGIAISIIAVDANRQSINIDLGGGYFEVYINDVKVEDLGRINRWNGETELELFRLTSTNEGTPELYISLEDLNITENGIYNVKVYHHARGGDNHLDNETTLLLDQDVTLTSNVKVENATSEVLTGFGMDPVLLYLDTYYGVIDDVTGNIAVLNSAGEEIFKSNIKSLSKDDEGRYYLKYSDFTNKDFGDKISVIYVGSERSGNTTIDVLWKDVNSTDFTPDVSDDVNDYYGDFINLNIPDLLTTGQIIVTLKFKGNHSTNLPNMNVTSDFGSQAVYRFNVADIKANYADGFKLSLSDLGFYEDDGDYDVDVKFTANGEDILDITNNTLNVAFSRNILITINETLRYNFEVPFASVKVFEPTNAYVDLYIDGELYAHKTSFDDGLIVFVSSAGWAVGNHTAEIRVINNEFGSLLNSSTVAFEVLAQTDDVEVTLNDNVKENQHVILTITVPQDGEVLIQIDGVNNYRDLVKGRNAIDLGLLPYGNHTLWVLYENNDTTSFYNNYLYVFVGDDGHWLTVPDPLVLDDDDTIRMNLGEGATGSVSVEIDGKLVGTVDLANGCAEFKLTDYITGANRYGNHSYVVTYSGDATHDRLVRKGTLYATYIFKDDITVEGYPLKGSYAIIVTLPDDATGTVRLSVDGAGSMGSGLIGADENDNGKIYESAVKDGKATFTVTDLTMGEHIMIFTYSGDNSYPRDTYSKILNVTHYAVVGEVSDYERYVSLMLPSNATGNLTVYNDNRKSVLACIPVVDGKAVIDLSNVGVGIYEIRAYYDGDDYEVKSFSATFRVMPKVYISQDVVMGDNGTIFMDLDNATGDVVIAMDGLDPKVLRIEEGIVNYTFSTEGYSHGNHTVNFYYFGKSFDGFIFYEEDGRTKIDYPLHILPKETTSEGQSNREVVTIYVRDNETGNIAWDAEGTVQFFIDGVEVAVVEVVNGIATLDISQFKEGDFVLSWIYSGDKKYGSSSNSLPLNVKHNTARINAGDANVLYANGKYSVTVYNADGAVASGVAVTFSINNKVFKTVNTDSKGIASVVITNAPGSYKITSKALGVSVTKNLNVNHILSLKKAKVKKSAKKLVLQATLKKVNGKYLKGKKITFKFNGKKYAAKTNKKGVAKATIKSKDLKKLKVGKKVKYQATYLKDTVKKSIKVKK